ncbi:hypothetical protein ACPA54_26600 [Uniformispora flossi]|uniref:hypothetical protein n=1 Tax=Uniformispora flossi TaxID=3390723 RepID=UPI003C2C6868
MAARAKDKYRTRKAAAGQTVRVPEQLPPGVRRCADCRAVKPVEDFSRNRSASSGYHSYCKPCGNARSAESRQRCTAVRGTTTSSGGMASVRMKSMQ